MQEPNSNAVLTRKVELRSRFFDLAHSLFTISSGEGLILDANQKMLFVLGLPLKTVLNKPIQSFMNSEDQAAYLKAIQRARQLGSEAPIFVENRIVTGDGQERLLAWTIFPLWPEQLLFFEARDISELKQILFK
jgi:PAS domain S-box-containing protein